MANSYRLIKQDIAAFDNENLQLAKKTLLQENDSHYQNLFTSVGYPQQKAN